MPLNKETKQSKNQREVKRDKYFDLASELKKLCNMKVTVVPVVNGALRIDYRTERLGNRRTSGHQPDYNIININQNTEKSPGVLRKLAVP